MNNDESTVTLTSTGSSNIELFDDAGEGTNKLTIECSNFACYLLSRRNFIANIHNGSDANSDVERISVDTDGVSLNTIQINLNNGENEMYFDGKQNGVFQNLICDDDHILFCSVTLQIQWDR